jgi:hypothetical protein
LAWEIKEHVEGFRIFCNTLFLKVYFHLVASLWEHVSLSHSNIMKKNFPNIPLGLLNGVNDKLVHKKKVTSLGNLVKFCQYINNNNKA